MAAQENLKPLKILVLSMGLLLIGGTVLLAALVWKKISAGHAGMHTAADCPGGQADLTGRGVIMNSTVDGHAMRVTLSSKPGHMETLLIDLCTSKISDSVTILSDPPKK